MTLKRTVLSFTVTDRLIELGFDREFSRIVGEQMNTNFTARMMLGYIRDANPRRMEDVADEMLFILYLRDKCMQKQIEKKRYLSVYD